METLYYIGGCHWGSKLNAKSRANTHHNALLVPSILGGELTHVATVSSNRATDPVKGMSSQSKGDPMTSVKKI